ELHAVEPDVRLAHADAGSLDREARDQLVGQRGRERLEQVEPPRVDLTDCRRDVAVVDRVLDPVARPALADLALDVVDEPLPVAALLLEHAVEAVQLDAAELDLHPPTASATRSASTCSRTSCARRIVAPRSYAATAAPSDAAVVPTVASGSPAIRPSVLLRDSPTSSGRPSSASSRSRRTSSRLCSTVLPKPI